MNNPGTNPGNDFFDKPRPQMIAAVDRFQGKWKENVGIAKIAWGVLTEDELLKTEGRLEKLAGLIQQRYAMSPPDAKDLVEQFIQKCGY